MPSFTKWLVHAEIISDAKNKELTNIGKLLTSIYQDNPSLVWEIIWVNLTYNSPIVKWYAQSVPFLNELADSDLKELVKNDYPDTGDTTVKNIVYALLRTLKESPIGEEIQQYISAGKQRFIRKPNSNISSETIAYSLYKYAELNDTRELRVSTLFNDNEHSPKIEFGLDKKNLLKTLRYLHTEGVLIAELNMGLDHITLKNDINSVSVLELLTK